MAGGFSIEVSNLNKSFGVMEAVRDISFTVAPGEVVGFLGPNGAGKSTTIKILCGLLAATSGRVRIGDISVAQFPEKIKDRVGYMPENNPLPEDMRINEYLAHRARLKGLRGKEVEVRVQEVLELCDLYRTARSKIISTLSKGFRQRVGIADVLLGKPELVIMDEPTIGLDPHQVLLMRKLIQSLKGQMTFVISSHILAEIEKVCDRVIIINRGSIVASGSSSELREEFIPVVGVKLILEGDAHKFVQNLSREKDLIHFYSIVDQSSEGASISLEVFDWTQFRVWLEEQLSHSSGLKINEIARLESSLEDIFMAATKRSWDDEGNKIKPYLTGMS
jgi:ABC-2 type transport system ATP-binding protein